MNTCLCSICYSYEGIFLAKGAIKNQMPPEVFDQKIVFDQKMVYLPVMRHDETKFSDSRLALRRQEQQYDNDDQETESLSYLYDVCLILINVMS